MYVVGHTVEIIDDVPQMKFDVVGSTGNIYKTIIGKVPTCNCPDALKGNQCKHILYGMYPSSLLFFIAILITPYHHYHYPYPYPYP